MLLNLILKNKELINELTIFYRDYIDVNLTRLQLIDNLKVMDKGTLLEILDGGYTDTDIRENICNYHSILMINESWPTYGDGELVYEKFINTLNDKYKELNYERV